MKVDIVIPTLNSESVIEDCLRAIKKYIPYNTIIIIDGGSKDKTMDICKKYDCKIFICKESLGESRMLGISKVVTDWFFFIDSDIVVNELFYNELIKFVGENIGALQGYAISDDMYYEFKEKIIPRELTKNERGYTNCTLIRTNLVSDINLIGINAYEDILIKNHIIDKGYKWLLLPLTVKHFGDFKGTFDIRLKARWNGAGLRKTKINGFAYLIRWFFGITFKLPIKEKISFKKYLVNLKYFYNTFIGFIFYKKYDKIER